MQDTLVLYIFMALMALNLVASFVYLIGLQQLKSSARKAYQMYRPR